MSALDTLLFGYRTCLDETVELPQRNRINFTGAGVVATDNPGTDSTDITIAGGGGGGGFNQTVQNAGVAVTQRAILNIVGEGLLASDVGGKTQLNVNTGCVRDGGVAANGENIRGTRTLKQSPIVNTKDGIVNFGSKTGGGGVGATESYTTISGGDQNDCTAGYATCIGGLGNVASGLYATVGGTTSVASGNFSVAIGLSCTASASGAVAFGDTCTASAANAIAIGTNCIASQAGATALGGASQATGVNSTSVGGGNASGTGAVALGPNTASGNDCIAAGSSCIAGPGSNAIAMGDSCEASANRSIALGDGCLASAANAVAIGDNCEATGIASNAIGRSGKATRGGQFAHASGIFTANGDVQFGRLIVRGTSVNAAAAILSGVDAGDPQLENGKAYAVRATCIANRTPGVAGRAMFVHDLLVHCTAGAAVIDNDNTTLSVPNGQVWTIAFTASGAGLRATFTGNAGATVLAAVTYEWTEITDGT